MRICQENPQKYRTRAGGGWRAFACLGLALAVLGALPSPREALAAKRFVIRPISWFNHMRLEPAGGSRFDTTITNVNGAMDAATAIAAVETSVVINTSDWAVPPGTQLQNGAVIDTTVIARIIVATDSAYTGNWSATTFNVDAVAGGDPRTTTVGDAVATNVYSSILTGLGSKPVNAFPVLLTPDAYIYNQLAAVPLLNGGLLCAPGIRVRFSSNTGILRRARISVAYWVDN